MRVSPVGFAFQTIEDVLARAEESAAVTHNHPEGIRGAQATAAAIFFARQGWDKNEIRRMLEVTLRVRPQYTLGSNPVDLSVR